MNGFELSPERLAGLRRAEILAEKINLLLGTIMAPSGRPFDYPAIRDAANNGAGYYLSRTRWSLLKSAKEQVVSDEALRAIASVFDIDPEYLIQEDGQRPERVEAALEQLMAASRGVV